MPALVCILYGLSLAVCIMGMYHGRFRTNLIQRVGLALLGLWFIWRIRVFWAFQVVHSDDILIALATTSIAIGTAMKTLAATHQKGRAS